MTLPFKIGTIIFTFFLLLLSFLSFHEWINVAIEKNTEDYPWGPINDNPWYYGSPETYANVMLAEGTAIVAGVLFTLYQLFRQHRKRVLTGIISLCLIFILILISGNIR